MIHSSLVPRAQPRLVRKMFTESLMKKMSFLFSGAMRIISAFTWDIGGLW